ncbi:MAG: helix-turn-helix transcriptional regulator [Clostridiales bacterium]|nr:helix-turn-helix transcriptional regulator [Clostridiales bacterium]
MDVLDKILDLRTERGWSEYRLSIESDIPQTTISSWYRKRICPTIPSLEKICKACNITMSQFFNDSDESVCLTEKQTLLIEHFSKLDIDQQDALLKFLSSI